MPSKSKKQAKLMRAVAHGWKPSRMKGPTRAVAKEFVDADKRRDNVTGYQFGGMATGMGPMYGRARGMMDQYRGVPPQRGALTQGRPGGLHPGARGPGGGFLSRFAQQTPGQPLHPGARGPGGGGLFARIRSPGTEPAPLLVPAADGRLRWLTQRSSPSGGFSQDDDGDFPACISLL